MKKPKTSRDAFEQAQGLEQRGRTEDAAALYRALISRNAQHDRALFRLGAILLQAGQVDAATRYLERGVEVRRDQPEYLTLLGDAYQRQGKVELATAVLTYAITVDPEYAAAYEKLALAQLDAGAHAAALEQLERVIELRPDDAGGYVNLAWALLLLHRPSEALSRAQRAVELAPTLAAAHRCVGDAFDMLGEKQRSIPSYRRVVELNSQDHVAHSNLIVSMLTDPSSEAKAISAEARAWAQMHAEPLKQFVRAHDRPRDPERRLRVGYVSPDFRGHPVQHFLVRLLEQHDTAGFEIFLYSSVERADAQTDWYGAFAGDHFRQIQGIDDVEVAELVRRDGIDILVDLAVHGPGNRLRVFACKPAPVQITWLGYAGTTGLDTIDYRITDPYLDPPDADRSADSETSLHLPETFWCYDALETNLPVPPLPALARGFVTFGSLNSPRKLHAGAVALWARVLREVPASRLVLYVEEHGREAVLRTLVAAGVERERVEFVGRVSRRAYLERHGQLDIALDTFPFGGGTTTLDAIWMGVPVVTLTGRAPLQRAGYSIAMNLGLAEVVAHTEDEFVERAVALASDLPRLAALRGELRSRLEASPLGDAPRFARQLEAIYRGAWRRYCEQR